jgi:hypothetical protein
LVSNLKKQEREEREETERKKVDEEDVQRPTQWKID